MTFVALPFLGALGPRFQRAPPVGDVSAFPAIEASLGAPLPADYKAFLLWSNGGATLPPLAHRRFHRLEELLAQRTEGQPTESIEFATDGTLGFAFDVVVGRHSASYAVISYPLDDTTRDDVELAADSFRHFLEILVDPRARYRSSRD